MTAKTIRRVLGISAIALALVAVQVVRDQKPAIGQQQICGFTATIVRLGQVLAKNFPHIYSQSLATQMAFPLLAAQVESAWCKRMEQGVQPAVEENPGGNNGGGPPDPCTSCSWVQVGNNPVCQCNNGQTCSDPKLICQGCPPPSPSGPCP